MSQLIKPLCLLTVSYLTWGLVLELIEINAPNYVVALSLIGWCALFGYSAFRFFEAWLR